MRPRISARLSADVAKRLEAAAERHGVSKTAIIEAALARYLDPNGDTNDSVALLRRLNWMSRQLEQLDRDLRIVSETAALHARYHLAVTPPLPVAEQRAACLLGAERFDVLAAQVGRRVHLGTPLMRETMDRLSVTAPELFADEREVVDVGSAQPDVDRASGVHHLNQTDPSSDRFAAVEEDGSNGDFQHSNRGSSISGWGRHRSSRS
jgi:predicted DNA-binding protein